MIRNDGRTTDGAQAAFEKRNAIQPEHYKGKVECIDALEVILGRNGVEDFCTGNAVKYLWRWRKKNGLEDLQKAQWYINKLVSYVQEDYDTLKKAMQDSITLPMEEKQ